MEDFEKTGLLEFYPSFQNSTKSWKRSKFYVEASKRGHVECFYLTCILAHEKVATLLIHYSAL